MRHPLQGDLIRAAGRETYPYFADGLLRERFFCKSAAAVCRVLLLCRLGFGTGTFWGRFLAKTFG